MLNTSTIFVEVLFQKTVTYRFYNFIFAAIFYTPGYMILD